MKTQIDHKVLTFDEFKNLKTKKLPGLLNRPVVASHVEKLRDIISENGFDDVFKLIRTNVFTKGKEYEYYVGDGNHRNEAISTLHLDQNIPVIILTCNSLDEIIHRVTTWNNAGKKWGLNQYLDTWAEFGNDHYANLKECMKKYKYPLSSLIEAYSDVGQYYNRKEFEKGRFEYNGQVGDGVISMYIEAILAGMKDSRGAFAAITRFVRSRKPSVEDLVKIIQRKKALFGDLTGRDDILQHLIQFYNADKKPTESKKQKLARLRSLNRMDEKTIAS